MTIVDKNQSYMKKLFFLLLIALIPALTPAQSIRIGDILCVQGTDTVMVHPGEYVDGAIGVVFYVDETGKHGWMLHPQIQAEGIYWSYIDELPWGLTGWQSIREAIYDLDGYDNTGFLRMASLNDHNIYPGAWVVDYENGWYWPSLGQLNILYGSAPIVNQSLQIIEGELMQGAWVYWSSSVYGFDNDCAIYLAYTGTMGAVVKSRDYLGDNPICVRSIRDF